MKQFETYCNHCKRTIKVEDCEKRPAVAPVQYCPHCRRAQQVCLIDITLKTD